MSLADDVPTGRGWGRVFYLRLLCCVCRPRFGAFGFFFRGLLRWRRGAVVHQRLDAGLYGDATGSIPRRNLARMRPTFHRVVRFRASFLRYHPPSSWKIVQQFWIASNEVLTGNDGVHSGYMLFTSWKYFFHNFSFEFILGHTNITRPRLWVSCFCQSWFVLEDSTECPPCIFGSLAPSGDSTVSIPKRNLARMWEAPSNRVQPSRRWRRRCRVSVSFTRMKCLSVGLSRGPWYVRKHRYTYRVVLHRFINRRVSSLIFSSNGFYRFFFRVRRVFHMVD